MDKLIGTIALAAFIFAPLFFIERSRTNHLERQLKQRDSINAVNLANHIQDSILISEFPPYRPDNYFHNNDMEVTD